MSVRILHAALGAVALLSAGVAAAQSSPHRYNDDLADGTQSPSDLSDSDTYDAGTPDGSNVYTADPADSYVVERPAVPERTEPQPEADYAAAAPPMPRDPVGTCRTFSQAVTMHGAAETAYGTACLQPDGAWKIMRKPVVASSSETFVPSPPTYSAPAYSTPAYREPVYREPAPSYVAPAPRAYSYAPSYAPVVVAPRYRAYAAPALPRLRATLRLPSFSAWLHGTSSHRPVRNGRRSHWRDG